MGFIATERPRVESYITEPTTSEAKLWNGWKSHGLKPAYEPILVAMKPNERTYANNALKYGVSGLNIDGGRIRTEDKLVAGGKQVTNNAEDRKGKSLGMLKAGTENTFVQNSQGRFPANIILDEEAGRMLDKQSGESKSTVAKNVTRQKRNANGVFDDKNNGLQNGSTEVEGFNDKGGASRFFYCAKAPKAERNKGCEELPKKQKVFNGQSPKSSKDLKDVEERFTTLPSANNHPTVKPLKLMEYLCILTKTPTGGIVLDPFMGSGTTGIACKMTDRKFVGIEMKEEYMKIAVARIKAYKKEE